MTTQVPEVQITALTPQVTVTVSPGASATPTSTVRKSAFLPGMTNSDTSLFYPWQGNDRQAVLRAKTLITQGLSLYNVQIMGWGVDDPWPNPKQSEPNNWETLDNKMQLALAAGTTPVITLCEAPWWMKGELQANGTTKLLSSADDFASIAYQSRILDNKMAAWLHLVQRVAERYMVAPYHVRHFQVWNELKGYYNPATDNWDMSTSPGKPSGANAQHGYTYMYNRVYETLRAVTREKGIDPNTLAVGGPYATINTWSSQRQSHPSNLVKAYGTYDQRSLDAVTYWLQHRVGGQFIALDASNQNDDNIAISDPFTAAEKFADTVQWIRSLNPQVYPGATTLPIWWAEWYANPPASGSDGYANALKAYALIKLIKAGGAVTLCWGGSDLWTSTGTGGGKPLPFYTTYKALRDYFKPGTVIYASASSSSQVEALASAQVTVLVNKTTRLLSVVLGKTRVSLDGYQVAVVRMTY